MIRSLFAGFALASLPVFAGAAVLTVEYATSVSTAYNWATDEMQSIAPITGSGSFTYDLGSPPTAQYWGTSVRAVFAGQSSLLGLSSPGIASVPFDPTTMHVEVNQLVAVLDDGSWSSKTLMAELNTVGWGASAGTMYYNWGLTWSDYEWGLNGESAYLLSAQDIIDSYRGLVISGAPVRMQEGYSLTMGGVMTGLTWTDENARITRVLVDGKDVMAAAAVPTPATYALLLPGLMLLGASVRRRRAPASAAC